ncbi:MAG: hypothetical protein U0Q12_13805 [Vicinamibacterales bacterium]
MTRRSRRIRVRLASTAGLVACACAAASIASAAPRLPKVLPESEEVALALEAAPEALRAGAGVWILTRDGYKEWRKAENGYTCVVNRDEIDAIKPTCYDPEGTDTILPAVVYFGNRLMAGVAVTDIRREIAVGFQSGRFRSPRRVGIAFMLSPHVVNVIDAAKGTTGTAPPHYMIYAPNVTNADLSLPDAAYDRHEWLPYVAYHGPHGFLIITVPDDAARSK